jgi:predicted enzyme related to lactoylglutathione lyase
MTTFTKHADGMPCWLDTSVADSSKRIALIDFYSALFGWEFTIGEAGTGFYSIAHLGGRPILGIGEQESGEGKWVTYFSTSDIEASQKKVVEAGGQVFFPAMKVMNLGSMALAIDPTGAVHGLWEAETFIGFGAMHEVNTFGWFDHVSKNTQVAQSYYLHLLGDAYSIHGEGEMAILRRGEEWFASFSFDDIGDKSPQWMPVFVVDSLERAKAKVKELGGDVIAEEIPVPGSSISIVREPITLQFLTLMASGDPSQ